MHPTLRSLPLSLCSPKWATSATGSKPHQIQNLICPRDQSSSFQLSKQAEKGQLSRHQINLQSSDTLLGLGWQRLPEMQSLW